MKQYVFLLLLLIGPGLSATTSPSQAASIPASLESEIKELCSAVEKLHQKMCMQEKMSQHIISAVTGTSVNPNLSIEPLQDTETIYRKACEIISALGIDDEINASATKSCSSSSCDLSDCYYIVEKIYKSVGHNLHRDLEKCCKKLSMCCRDTQNQLDECCTDIHETITTCCQEILDAITAIPDCCDTVTAIFDTVTRIEVELNDCCTTLNNEIHDSTTLIIDTITTCCEEIKDAITALPDCCDTVTAIFERVTEIETELADCCTTLNAEINNSTTLIVDTITICCEEIKDAITGISGCCDTVTAIFEKVTEIEAELTDCCTTLNNEINNSTTLIVDTITTCCEEIKDAITALPDCCDTVTAIFDTVTRIEGELSDCCTTLNNEIHDSTTLIIDTITTCCEEIKDAITALPDCCDTVTAIYDRVTQIETDLNDCCTSLTSDISSSTSLIVDTVTTCCQEIKDAITALPDCCDTVTAIFNTVTRIEGELNDCCTNLSSEINSSTTLIVDTITNCCEEIKDAITGISGCCDTVTAIYEKVTQTEAELTECCITLNNEINNSTTLVIDTVNTCCEEIKEAIAGISGGSSCGTAITAAQIPFTISKPGLYYLQESVSVNNVTSALEISADNVILDLCENIIIGENECNAGVTASGRSNITIKNGTIQSMDEAAINLEDCSNVELSDLKVVDSLNGVRLSNCVNSLVSNVASYDCSSNGFFVEGECLDEAIRSSRNNCFMQCKVYGNSSDADSFGFRSIGGQNNSFIECTVNSVATLDTKNASTVAGFSLGVVIDGDKFCNEIGTNIIDCEIQQVSAANTLNNGGSTPYGIKFESTFNVNDAAMLEDQKNNGTQVNSVAWAPSGCYIATGATPTGEKDFDTKIWQVNQMSGEMKLVQAQNAVSGSSDPVNSVAFSPDGCFLVAGGQGDGNFNIGTWDFDDATGQLTDNMVANQGATVFAVAFSPDGAFLATGSNRKNVSLNTQLQIWSINQEGGTPLLTSAITITINNIAAFSIRSLAWSPDGRFLATGENNNGTGNIRIWAFDPFNLTLTEIVGSPYAYGTSVNALAYSPDGCFLASGATAVDSEIKIWKVNKTTGALTNVITQNADQGDQVNGLSWSRDGNLLISAGKRDVAGIDVKYWKFDATVPSISYQTGYAQGASGTDFALSVAVSPTDCFLASGAKAPNVINNANQGQLQTRSLGIIYPEQCLIKRNEITRVSGGCGGCGIQGGCNNLFLNNIVYEADIPYNGVTNVYAKGLDGAPHAFDNAAFPPTCTQGQCAVNKSGFEDAVKNALTKSLVQKSNLSSMITRSPSSVTSADSASIKINGLPFVIKKPGTYILSTDAQIIGAAAITIASSNVTLDLAGHTLQGEGGFLLLGSDPSYGVRTFDGNGYTNITVMNGTISDMSAAGIYIKDSTNVTLRDMNIINCNVGIEVEGTPINDPDADMPTASQVVIEDIRAANNNKAGYYITGVKSLNFADTIAENNGHDTVDPDQGGYVISSSFDILAERSIATSNTYGFYLNMIHSAVLRSCGALFNANTGFYLLGQDPGTGFVYTQRMTMQQCKAISNKGKGISLNGCKLNTIVECEFKSNTEEGLFLSTDSTFNFVNRIITSTNGSAAPFYPGIRDGSSVNVPPITTNRIFTNFAQNNGDPSAAPLDAYNDSNYANVPAIIRLAPVPGGTALAAVGIPSAGALSNLST